MIALPIRIALLEPLLATSLEGDPNSATSYPFIPGSLLRGALAARYMQRSTVDATDVVARRLFFEGTTRYLNAYPLDREGMRTLPTPMSWMVEKDSDPNAATTRIYDWSCGREDCDLEQPKTLGKPFCRFVGETVELYEPLKQVNIHTQRDRDRIKGRPSEDSGTIFRYEALAPGQDFGAVILFDNEPDVECLLSLLRSDALLLGGSQGAGYGRVDTEIGEPQVGWCETDNSPITITAGETFTITLLSDALLRDGRGQYATTLVDTVVASWLQVDAVEIVDSFKQNRVIGGFNRKWGLPLPQTPVISAGSVFVVRASEQPITSEMIASLESRGIGQRRAEGFGRLAINWHREPELKLLDDITPSPQGRPSVTLSGEGLTLARQMLERLLWKEIDNKLVAYVNARRADLSACSISPSQLGRLRAVVRGAQPNGDTARLLRWLKDLKRTARSQFEAVRLAKDTRLRDWLDERLNDPQSVWTEIGGIELPRIAQVQTELTDGLSHEVTIRLIDGVLAMMGKEGKKDE